MKNNSTNLLGNKPGDQRRSSRLVHVACCLLLGAGLTGCESLQRKLTRKPKHPAAAPTPIINFQDYTRAMTPVDRYRKHYLMFDYWNDELIEALQSPPLNPKRFKHASAEALSELETMRSLLTEDTAQQLTPLIEERAKINGTLQSPSFSSTQANSVGRSLESQSRQIQRQFTLRDVEDHLKEQ